MIVQEAVSSAFKMVVKKQALAGAAAATEAGTGCYLISQK